MHPAAFGVHQGELDHHRGFELQGLARAQRAAGADLLEDHADFALGVVLGVGGVEAVIGEPAAVLVEIAVTLAEGLDVGGEAGDLDVAELFELVDEDVELGEVLDRHGRVGPPGGVDLDLEAVALDPPMVVERIERALGRADEPDVHLPHDAADAELARAEHLAALLVDFQRGVGAEQPAR